MKIIQYKLVLTDMLHRERIYILYKWLKHITVASEQLIREFIIPHIDQENQRQDDFSREHVGLCHTRVIYRVEAGKSTTKAGIGNVKIHKTNSCDSVTG